MSAKRSYYDWVREEFNERHVVVASTMFGRVLESTEYPAQTDLRKVLIETLAKWSGRGWAVETFRDDTRHFFARKDETRINVCVRSAGHSIGQPADFMNKPKTNLDPGASPDF